MRTKEIYRIYVLLFYYARFVYRNLLFGHLVDRGS
jgi:hypothetical protein